MKIIKTTLLIGLIACLTSCASLQSFPTCDVHVDTELPILHPSAFAANLIINQQVTIETPEHEFDFISQFEVNNKQLILVALTPIGQKLFQIQYRPQELQFQRFGIPDSFNPAFLLTDVSFIYGDKKALETCYQLTHLPRPSISMQNQQRTISYPGQKDITITYSSTDKWSSNIVFKNPARNYTIEIKSLSVEHL